MDHTILFTHLKFILLQCFQFSIFSNNKFNSNTPLLNPRPTYQPTKQVRPTRWGKEPHPLGFSSLDVRRVQTPNPSCMPTRE